MRFFILPKMAYFKHKLDRHVHSPLILCTRPPSRHCRIPFTRDSNNSRAQAENTIIDFKSNLPAWYGMRVTNPPAARWRAGRFGTREARLDASSKNAAPRVDYQETQEGTSRGS